MHDTPSTIPPPASSPVGNLIDADLTLCPWCGRDSCDEPAHATREITAADIPWHRAPSSLWPPSPDLRLRDELLEERRRARAAA